jgi:hypothetical protein
MAKPSKYAHHCIEFRMELAWWAVEERRNHDLYRVFADAVRDYAREMRHGRPLRPRDWRATVDMVTARAWAAEVEPPEEELEPEAQAFMAALRREIHGY